MRCVACNRPVLRFALSIPSRQGVIGWGPQCAKRIESAWKSAKAPRAEAIRRRAVMVDPAQMALGLEQLETA